MPTLSNTPDQVATLLAQICCHRDALPQGAPTSPIISNYICRGMDRRLAKLAISNSCYYTRYADDLVFSTDRSLFPAGIAIQDGGKAAPSAALSALIERAGFRINSRKTRLQISFQRQRVTGLIVNEKVNVPRRYVRGLRALLHIWKHHGEAAASKSLRQASPDPNWPPGKPYPSLALVARGRLQYIGSVRGKDDPAYLKLAQKLAELDPHFDAPQTVPAGFRRAHLYTEGPTDPKHIRAALAHFHAQGEFSNLDLVIDEETDRGSDQKLKEYCERLKEFGPQELALCLFDSDTKIAKDAVGSDGWREYGPKVVAVGLAPPSWLDQHDPICIELLYEETVLKTKDSEGRRVYQSAEFHPVTSIHESENCVVPYATKNKEHLIAPDVFEVGSNTSIARSKAAFANAIAEDPDSFDDLSFEGFRPTFDRISVALASLKSED